MTRHVWVVVHRWAGPAMAGFLVIVGLTGSSLLFEGALHRRLDPDGA